MPFSLLPKLIFHRLTDITPEFLHRRGIDLLMLDFDNTMLPYTTQSPTQELLIWLAKMKRNGIRLCVVSNSKKPRVAKFCKKHKLSCIIHSKKPSGHGIRQCMALFHATPAQTALVGDQIFTDVLGANCAGSTSILIQPIHLHNIWLKLRHGVEQPIIHFAKKRSVTK